MLHKSDVLLGVAMSAAVFFIPPAMAQTTACHTYDATGRLKESEYSDGSEIRYNLDRNDNRNSVQQAPSGAASCATPTVTSGPIPGGNLGTGSGSGSGGAEVPAEPIGRLLPSWIWGRAIKLWPVPLRRHCMS